ncbi:MAG: hypothetical protein IJ702_02860 [Fretibacterium sp.]|nr:hypothetical protein [Fretibacterium sp.]
MRFALIHGCRLEGPSYGRIAQRLDLNMCVDTLNRRSLRERVRRDIEPVLYV